jgi:hypothetical protein
VLTRSDPVAARLWAASRAGVRRGGSVAVSAVGLGTVRVGFVVCIAFLGACGGADRPEDEAVGAAAEDTGADPEPNDGRGAPPVDDRAAPEVRDDAEAAESADAGTPHESENGADAPFGDRDEPWAAGADGSLPADFVLPPTRLSESSGSDHVDYLDMLHDACERENMGACDALRLVAPLAGEYHQFGEDCGGHREPDETIFQDCRRHRPTDAYAANAGAQITDAASAAAWWDDRQLHDPVLIAEFCRGFGAFREEGRSHDGFRLVFLRVEEEVEGLDLDREYRADFEQFADDRCAAGR